MAAVDVSGAYKAGYSDAEIADYLAQQVGMDISGTRKAGYSDREIVNYLSANQPESGPGAALEAGVEELKAAGASLLGRTGIIDTDTAEQYIAEREAQQRMTFKPTEGGFLDSPISKTAELVGGSAPFMTGPIAAGLAGTAFLGPLGGTIAFLGASALQYTGTNLRRQMETGKSLEETDLGKAALTSVPQSIADRIGARYIPGLKNLFIEETGKELTEAQLKKIIERSLAGNVMRRGAAGATSESLTETVQQSLERAQADLAVLGPEAKEEYVEALLGGGILGFVFSAPGGIGASGRAQRTLDATEAERQAAQIGPQTPEPGAITAPATPEIREQLTDYDRALFEAQFPSVTEAAPPATPPATPPVTPVAPQDTQAPTTPTTGTPPPAIVDLIGEQNEREVAAVRAAREEEQQIAQLKLESDIAELDASIQNKQQKTAEDRRLELLLPLVENPEISSIPSAFDKALKNAGIRDTEFTERERNLIQRAQDVRAALTSESTSTTQASTTPTPTPAARAPEQLTLPGVMGRQAAKRLGKTRPVPAPEAAEVEAGPAPIIDEQALNTLKLPKTSMLRKQLLGKDMNDPVQNQEVNKALRAALQNPKMPADTKQAIRGVVNQSEFTRQGELFGPLGGVLPQATPRAGATDVTPEPTPAPSVEPTTERPAGEPSVGVASVGDGPAPSSTGAPGAVSEPEVGGLAGTDVGTRPDVGRVLPESVSEAVTTPPELKGAAKRNYEAYVDQVTDAAIKNPAEALLSTTARVNNPQVLTKQDKVLETIAGDIYSGLGNTRSANNIYKSLPADQKAKVDTFLQNYKDMEQRGKTTIAWLDAIQNLDTQTRDQVYEDLSKLVNVDALPLQNPLSSEVVSRLRAGDIVGALNELSGRTKGTTSRTAKYLADKLSGARVSLVDNATMGRVIFERTGKVESNIKGVYFASDKTIFVNSDIGLDIHTLLHEPTHHLVDTTLDNKSHPLTRQLQNIFDSVKGGLGTAYGTTDLKEFAAEFMSNPEFRTSLDSLYPDGGKISALRKIVNAVGNFLRRAIGLEPKKVESAFDTAGNIIYSIMEPGQTALQPSMTMSEMSFLRKGSEPIDGATLADRALPFLKQEQRDKLDAFFRGGVAGGVKKLVRMSLPINALVDIAKNTLPSATRVQELIQQRTGTENQRHQMIEPIEVEAKQFAKKSSLEQMTTFNDVVYDSTIEGVDPTKLRNTYKGDAGKLQVWDDLQSKWKSIGPEGKALYTRMRDTYKKLYEDILKVIDQRLDSATGDVDTNKRIKKDILSKLAAEAGKIDPYFPLTREGDYWISYSLQGGGNADFVVEAFKTPAARDRAIAALRQDENLVEGSIELFAKSQKINYANAPSGSFMNSVFTTLKANQVDPEVTEQLMNLFLNSLPASSFAQSFRKRKGTTGFERDSLSAFRKKVYNISQQLANLEYGAKLNDARDQIRAEYETAYRQGDEAAREYFEEFDKRIDFAVNPSVDKWSQVATSYGFLATLGFNLSSAVVNLSQIPLMVFPYYGGKYGYGKSMSALGRATKLYANSGMYQDRTTILGDKKRMRVAPSIQNYNFDDPNLPANLKPYKYLVEVGQDLGQMNRSQAYDILEVGNLDNPLSKINAASGFVFHHGERMNREIALAAAYDLELQALGKNPTPDQMREAAKRAVEITELVNGGISSASAPRIAQNSLGRVMFMYKRYGVSMYYAMFKMARDIYRGETPEIRKAGMKQIAGIFLSAGMLAGAQGLPLFGVGALVYNMFKEDDEDDAQTAVRKFLGEGLYKGPVNFLTGADVASRIGLSDLLFRDNPVKREQEPMAEIMEFIGGPVYSVTNRALRGVRDIREGDVQRGVEQILPSAFGNALKSLRFATEGVNTRRGDPILEDIGFGSAVAQAFGFAPAEYTRQLEINSVEKGKERYVTERRTKLLRQYYLAIREGDADEAENVMRDIQEFNQRHPTIGITGESILRSMKQHGRTTSQMYKGVTYNKQYLPEFLESMREYNDE